MFCRNRKMSVSCTPLFKQDAQKAWVTQDSLTAVSIWFNRDRGMTLEDMVETIEHFLQTMPGYSSQITSCTFESFIIRGEQLSKGGLMMTGHMAADKLKDGESFRVMVTKHAGAGCCVIL